ncbi:LysM peptidoglycan-binding domain-containing protein [Fibrobacterota bacterium]
MQDSLWFEAEANLDSALGQIHYLKSLDSLNTHFYQVLDQIRDSIYSLLIEIAANSTQLQISLPWTAYWDVEMENVSDSQMVMMDSLVGGINPKDFDLPLALPLHPRVRKALVVLNGPGRKYFSKWLNRRSRYQDLILSRLEANHLPGELLYLAMVESGFSPRAWSRAKASGIWQFIKSTGKRYGLTYDWWIDERRDPEKATEAAIKYLTFLYGEFNDWYLAMAGYNCGEGRIRRKLREDSTQTFWDMELPKETMNYVPKILAAMIIGKNPERYGFHVEPETTVVYDTATVNHCISLAVIAEAAGAEEEEVKKLNVELRRWCTPPHMESYVVKVPLGTRETFLENYRSLDKSKLISWHRHIVSKGETLGLLSRKYGVPIDAIKSTNNLKGNLIRIRQSLLIPLPGKSGKKNARKTPLKKKMARGGKKDTDHIIYKVKSGDNLYDIARKFGISVSSLMQANQLNQKSVIKPGQKLKVRKGGKPVNDDVKNKTPGKKFHAYRVRAGDNLTAIGRKLDVSVRDLMKWNSLTDHEIKIGQFLKYKMKGKEQPFYYIVKPRDNLWDVAKRFKTTVTEIKKLNIDLSETLKPGMKIRIR